LYEKQVFAGLNSKILSDKAGPQSDRLKADSSAHDFPMLAGCLGLSPEIPLLA
jgi:hypothetical protein